MSVKLRLMRLGVKKRPFYRVVAMDIRSPRDGRSIDTLGYYNPIPEESETKIDEEKVFLWLERGATLSQTVKSLLKRQGILQKWNRMKFSSGEVETPPEKPFEEVTLKGKDSTEESSGSEETTEDESDSSE